MGIRNRSRETLDRLAAKTLDAGFLHEIEHGLNCSPFEAEAVLQVVQEVYFPFLDTQQALAPPGKVTLIAVAAEVAEAKKAAAAQHERPQSAETASQSEAEPAIPLIQPAAEVSHSERKGRFWVVDRELAEAWLRLHTVPRKPAE